MQLTLEQMISHYKNTQDYHAEQLCHILRLLYLSYHFNSITFTEILKYEEIKILKIIHYLEFEVKSSKVIFITLRFTPQWPV